jgi:hypothetical protein
MNDRIRRKIDPLLQRIVDDRVATRSLLDIQTDTNGVKWYGVIIHTNDVDAVRAFEGIRFGSTAGDLVTAHVRREHLFGMAAIESVLFIEASTVSKPIGE